MSTDAPAWPSGSRSSATAGKPSSAPRTARGRQDESRYRTGITESWDGAGQEGRCEWSPGGTPDACLGGSEPLLTRSGALPEMGQLPWTWIQPKAPPAPGRWGKIP